MTQKIFFFSSRFPLVSAAASVPRSIHLVTLCPSVPQERADGRARASLVSSSSLSRFLRRHWLYLRGESSEGGEEEGIVQLLRFASFRTSRSSSSAWKKRWASPRGRT